MLNEKDIKPIPKYMLKLIQQRDKKDSIQNRSTLRTNGSSLKFMICA